jgi:hypothetical protein
MVLIALLALLVVAAVLQVIVKPGRNQAPIISPSPPATSP